MSGLELVAAIATLPALRANPVAVLTTFDDPAQRRAALALHVAGYFVKRASRGHLDGDLQLAAGLRRGCRGRPARGPAPRGPPRISPIANCGPSTGPTRGPDQGRTDR